MAAMIQPIICYLSAIYPEFDPIYLHWVLHSEF